VSWWRRKRKEPRDRHREFIYLDDVSVVSLLAALQGEIKQSVTDTLTQTDEAALSTSVSGPKGIFRAESSTGSTQSSAREVVRRAVIQSTFRDLWRSDVGVLLHDTESKGRIRRTKVSTLPELKRELKGLRRDKLAVELADIKRGSILEMDVRLEADQFFKMVTLGSNLLDLIDGKEALFGVAADDIKQVSPIIEVLKELSVGLVPVRGISTSHYVIELDGVSVVVAQDVLASDSELLASVRELELVGFTETGSYWRDLRRTLFSGSTYTAYVRVEKGPIGLSWNPIKIADLFEEVAPGLGDNITASLHELRADTPTRPKLPVEAPLPEAIKLRGFANDLASELAVAPDPEAIENAVEKAAMVLSKAGSVTERRRAYDILVDIVADDDVDREVVRRVRDPWIDRAEFAQVAEQPKTKDEEEAVRPVQLEVGFVALYW
jgi:hypothetical protein